MPWSVARVMARESLASREFKMVVKESWVEEKESWSALKESSVSSAEVREEKVGMAFA